MSVPEPRSRSFATTNWSLVARARDADPEVRREALDSLLRAYLPALRGFLIRGLRLDPTSADDLVQGFVADKILAQNLLGRVDRDRGRLRSVLVKVLQHYAIDALRRRRTESRRVDALAQLEADREPDSDVFAAEWAREILERALESARSEALAKRRPEEWELLDARIVQPALCGAEPPAYEDLVARFGFRDIKQAENALVTAKRRLRRAVEQTIREYAAPDEVEDEISDLIRALGRTPLDASSAPGQAGTRALPWSTENRRLEASDPGTIGNLLQASRDESTWNARDLRNFFDRAMCERWPDERTASGVLSAQRPSVAELIEVKRWTQAQSQREPRVYPRVVLQAIGDQATALALITSGQLISRTSRGDLAERLGKSSSHPWMAPAMCETLRVAAGLLQVPGPDAVE